MSQFSDIAFPTMQAPLRFVPSAGGLNLQSRSEIELKSPRCFDLSWSDIAKALAIQVIQAFIQR
jgi:hypothetical protein